MAGRNTGGRSTTSSYPSVRSATGANGSTIVERCWEAQPPGSEPKAGLVVIHGGTMHSGWFGELGDLLSSPEFAIRVSAPDLPGHGLSGDTVPGYRFYAPDFADNAAEVGAALARARAALPEGCPVFLLGESMGATCALQHLLSDGVDDNVVDGIILCAIPIEINPALLPPKVIFPVLKAVGWLMPTLPLPGSEIGGETFETAFGDPAVGPVARADPLTCEMEPPRLGYVMGNFRAVDMVKRQAPENLRLKAKSVLMIHYKRDQRTHYEGCQRFVDGLSIEDKVSFPLGGDHHQVFQDTPEEARKHIERVGRFITERIG
eukprot:g16014.t5